MIELADWIFDLMSIPALIAALKAQTAATEQQTEATDRNTRAAGRLADETSELTETILDVRVLLEDILVELKRLNGRLDGPPKRPKPPISESFHELQENPMATMIAFALRFPAALSPDVAKSTLTFARTAADGSSGPVTIEIPKDATRVRHSSVTADPTAVEVVSDELLGLKGSKIVAPTVTDFDDEQPANETPNVGDDFDLVDNEPPAVRGKPSGEAFHELESP